VIKAVRDRMRSVRQLRAGVELRTRLPARAALVDLLRLLAEGCRSDLEIWGLAGIADSA
jgi:hypothetical protein